MINAVINLGAVSCVVNLLHSAKGALSLAETQALGKKHESKHPLARSKDTSPPVM